MLTKQEIKKSIIYYLDSAYNKKNNIRHYLEQLPMVEDYDEAVHNYINDLEYYANHYNKDTYNAIAYELINHYYINQKNYNF